MTTQPANAAPSGRATTFLGLPIYGGVDPFFFQSMMTLMHSRPGNLLIETNIGDSLVTRSRNTLTASFLKGTCDQLLFIDSDLIFTPEQVQRICDCSEPVVGGFYAKKQQGRGQLVCNTSLPQDMKPPRPDGLQEVRYMGTGFFRVKRFVFEMMIKKYGDQIAFKPDESPEGTVQYDFWGVGTYKYSDGSVRYLSEDWLFCQRCMDMGLTVWGDTAILVPHRGMTDFPLQTQRGDIFGPVPAPVAPAGAPSLPVDHTAGATRLASEPTSDRAKEPAMESPQRINSLEPTTL
jgi:hypothetical protein